MHFYKVHLPKSSTFEDEYETWIESSFKSRMDEGLYRETEREYEDDILPVLPNGSFVDDLSIDNTPPIIID
jgi:hypothetical protein